MTEAIRVDGDTVGFYAAVCDDCTGGPLGVEGCGPTRYYKRAAKADAEHHRGAHAAWARGIRYRAWPE